MKKENGDTLERLTNGDEYHNKIKSLIFEIKIWRDKQDRLDNKISTNEDVAEKQSDKIVEVQKGIDKIKSKIGSSDQEPAKPGVTKRRTELDQMMEEKEQIKKEYES